MDIIKGLGTAATILREADKIPQYEQILEAMKRLTDQEAEIFELKKENRDLKEKLDTKADLDFRNDSYWKKDGTGPFCSVCQDAKGVLVRMHSHGKGMSICRNCDHVVDTDPAAVVEYERQQELINAQWQRDNSPF